MNWKVRRTPKNRGRPKKTQNNIIAKILKEKGYIMKNYVIETDLIYKRSVKSHRA